MEPLTEAGDKTSESTECQPDQSVKSPSRKQEITVHSEIPQSVPETKLTESGKDYSPAQDSGKQSSPVRASKDLDPCLSTSLATEQTHVPSSIEWPTVTSGETKKKVPLSATATPVTDEPSEKTKVANSKDAQIETVLTQQDEVQLHKIEENNRTQKEKEEEKREKGSEKEASRKEKDQEEEKEEKQVERESIPDKRGKRDNRGMDWKERLEELGKEWRKKRGKEMEEKEKGIARKPVKPLGSRKSSTSYGDPHVAPHSSSSQFPSGHSRFSIPLHRGSGFHSPHPLPLPPPSMPRPRPPPPQPFLGFTPHPFHQPPATPFTPPHPPQPPDIWSMFGSLFAQHNLFPAEEPPPPPPRPPSPPLPPLHYSPPRGLSPCHSSPRRMSPQRSPSPHQDSSPHYSPSPCSSPAPMGVSPSSGPAAFFSRARARSRSRSSSPVPKSQPLEPKPSQLDAKQFRFISELVKRTTVKKCDIAVQAVSPRKVSEGTQDGRGFRLCSTAVQVKARTRDVSTYTDIKTEVQHRSV